MSKAIEILEDAFRRAMAIRPKVGGFPYLAETLRQAGVTRNLWYLPACQSLYLTKHGPVVSLGAPLVSGSADVSKFDREALIAALRTDQAGQSTFPEFLSASWRAGVVRYDFDLSAADEPPTPSNTKSTRSKQPAPLSNQPRFLGG